MGQLLMKMLVGAAAGLVIWMLFEPTWPTIGSPNESQYEQIFTLCLGALIGLAVGALNGWIQGSKVHLMRGAGLGLVFGAIGAPFGYMIGGVLLRLVMGDSFSFISPNNSIATNTAARVIALTPIGLFLGAAIGASSLNKRRTIQGAIGGLIGGGVAGLLFDTVGAIVSPMAVAINNTPHGKMAETGSVSRALTAILIGGLIALFIAIVDLVARSAWVRLVLGRNEGKEWPIDSAQTFIGRAEGANIPLFGDPNIAPMHACIMKQGQAYTISDGGSPMGTYVNGQRIQSAPLFHGAQIQIGSFQLQFLVKHGAAPARGPENFNQAYAIQNQPPGSVPAGVSPYQAPGAGFQAPGTGHLAPGVPPPGSLYGSQPTQGYSPPAPGGAGGGYPAPGGAGSFAAQQPTVAFPSAAAPGTQHPAPSFTLTVLDGPLIGQRYPIRGAIELGRESATVPMSYDTGASRRHASVAPGAMGVMVSDLNSTNGTFVNGQRVQTANAGPGDVIRIGATSFRVEPG